MLEIWTTSQRKVVLVIVCLLACYLAVRSMLHPQYVSDPQPIHGSRAHELADRIDPNTADWPALAVLPMVGEKRARDIVAYRESALARNPGEMPFRRIEDLLKISGFGSAMIAHLRPHLFFPATAPSTRPT